jgi:hypothetical protein
VLPLPLLVRVPEGTFSSGTEPGRFERQPELEPRLTRTSLGAFEIDTEPYPGGSATPLLGLGRDAASALCIDRGGRLCTELEWERACKGPASTPFPSGADWEPGCEGSPGCASAFGVRGMGSLREWTASDIAGRSERLAIVRGAAPEAAIAQRRCAHREAVPAAPRPDIGFRCCHGAPNGARVVAARLGAAFAPAELTLEELARLLASDAATRDIARDLSYFDPAGAVEAVLARGNRQRAGLSLTSAPLAWNPAPGVELLIVSARSGASTSFVVVFDALGDGSHQLAASFIMEDEPGPVALAYGSQVRPRLQFSTCWGCPGETGKILYSDPDRVQILQP